MRQIPKYKKNIYLDEREMISYVFYHIKCFDERIMNT
jgi:hypothetical protein